MNTQLKKISSFILSMMFVAGVSGCSSETKLSPDVKPASEHTRAVNTRVNDLLDLNNTQESEFAVRGLIDAPENLELKDPDGRVVWSQKAYGFLDDSDGIPDSANPALWLNTVNNHSYGLFKVTDGIYQVRGYDMANLTVIDGEEGRIVVDPLGSVECSKAAMQLIEKNLGKKDVKAIIISHPHVDHFGGIGGIADDDQIADSELSLTEQVKSGKIPVIAPEGFAVEAVGGNLYAGEGMSRRAQYQYGSGIEASVRGRLGIGIGMDKSRGTPSYIAPTYEIKPDEEKITLSGVEIEFQLTSGAEAPAEMNMWFPQKKALWLAGNCTATLHNTYDLSGTPVRDANAWAKYILGTIQLYGLEAEVVFQSHNWPRWGNKVILKYLEDTAAVYKFINDQTLTYINQGYTSEEISNMIELPESLAKNLYTRQYYGTLAHNARAVYQKYMGWYDANPVNLNPLTPSESAKKWVEYLGDIDEVLEKAREDFAKGEYRWVAEITNVIVYADPKNKEARYLCADALEQLGYQSESGAWRNAYLSAASELRGGVTVDTSATPNIDIGSNMTADMIFDYMSIKLDKKNLENEDFTINFVLSDTGGNYAVHFKSGIMLVYKNILAPDANTTLTCQKSDLLYMLQNNYDMAVENITVEGDRRCFDLVADNIDEFDESGEYKFNIIEP